MEGCENITDPEITCNDSTVYGLPLDDMQHGIECNQTLSSCSIIDGLSADILQVKINTLVLLAESCKFITKKFNSMELVED